MLEEFCKLKETLLVLGPQSISPTAVKVKITFPALISSTLEYVELKLVSSENVPLPEVVHKRVI